MLSPEQQAQLRALTPPQLLVSWQAAIEADDLELAAACVEQLPLPQRLQVQNAIIRGLGRSQS